jgi:hypothetical protein
MSIDLGLKEGHPTAFSADKPIKRSLVAKIQWDVLWPDLIERVIS